MRVPSTAETKFRACISLGGGISVKRNSSLDVDKKAAVMTAFVMRPLHRCCRKGMRLGGTGIACSTTVGVSSIRPFRLSRSVIRVPLNAMLKVLFPGLSFRTFLSLGTRLSFFCQVDESFDRAFRVAHRGNRFSCDRAVGRRGVSSNSGTRVSIALGNSLCLNVKARFRLKLPFRALKKELGLHFKPGCDTRFKVNMLRLLGRCGPSTCNGTRLDVTGGLSNKLCACGGRRLT